METRITQWIVAAASAIFLSGCATYVNIPAHAGDVATHDANWGAVQRVQAAAVRAALAEKPIDAPFRVVLAPGTKPSTYDLVLPRISPHAKAPAAATDGDKLPVLEVREVHIRGAEAHVDITRPWDLNDPAGYHQLLTVDLSWEAITQTWNAVRVTAWRTSADNALRTSSTEPPPESAR